MNTGKMKFRWQTLLWLLPLGFLAVFYFYPLGSILAVSLERAENGIGAVILEVWGSPSIRKAVGFTFWQAGLSTLLTLMIGLPGAYLFGRYEFQGKQLLRALTSVPFVMPTLVVAAAFDSLLGGRGWLNLGLMQLFNLDSAPIQVGQTLTAILLAHIFYNTTIVIRLVGDFWTNLDPRLTQAARMLGAKPWQAWLRVTLPLLAPALLAAALLVFIFDFTSFGVILILGGPKFATIEVEIFYQAISLFNLPAAAVLASIQLITTLALTTIYTRLVGKLSRPLTRRSEQVTLQRLSTWRQRAMAGWLSTLMLVLFVTPLVSLGLRSVVQLEPERRQRTLEEGPALTGAFYRSLWEDSEDSMFTATPGEALLTSMGYAGSTVVISLLLGFPAAWMLAWQKEDLLSRVLDPLLMLPIGTSAVTLGLGFIVALNRPPLDLRTSPALIPLAHSLVALPFVVRSLTPALRTIQPQLRQAAAMLGANPGQVIRFIDLPLVGRALLGSAVFAFTISLGEFGATALVGRPDRPTVPMMIYRYLGQPGALNYGRALALSTILMLATAAGMLLIERVRVGEGAEF
ncbi:MAG: iron ABC transporter permease [Anaerolineales bacterium]|nr:iron ABC transporter permease [Anaerolineales bacterium]